MNDSVTFLTRRADLAPASANRDDRTVEVIWSTGAAVRRRDMAGPYVERLSLAPEAVDLSRLQGASVLDAHRQSAVRDVLGSVQSATVDGQRRTALNHRRRHRASEDARQVAYGRCPGMPGHLATASGTDRVFASRL